MLHETATSPDYAPLHRIEKPQSDNTEKRIMSITKLVEQVFDVDHIFVPDSAQMAIEDLAFLNQQDGELLVSYQGQLIRNSEAAYDQLDEWLVPFNLMALFREQQSRDIYGKVNTRQIIHIIEGRVKVPPPMNTWLNLVLFIATVLSVLLTGTFIAAGEAGLTSTALHDEIITNIVPNLWRGAPYAIAIMLILVAHEGGHYIMMRRRRVHSSLPYFIPLPILSPFGTLGAAILLRGPLRNRKVLLDVGASGPLAGMFFALPILLLGLATSLVLRPTGDLVQEGNSILYALAKITIFGRFLPGGGEDVLVNQLAWAGWTGMFVTALNLLPIGQLDGGHVLYAILGDHARRLYFPMMAFLLVLILFISSAWLMLFVLMFMMGRFYAIPLDNITRLNPGRQWLAAGMMILFILVFVPMPLGNSDDVKGLLASTPFISSAMVLGLRQALWRIARLFPTNRKGRG